MNLTLMTALTLDDKALPRCHREHPLFDQVRERNLKAYMLGKTSSLKVVWSLLLTYHIWIFHHGTLPPFLPPGILNLARSSSMKLRNSLRRHGSLHRRDEHSVHNHHQFSVSSSENLIASVSLKGPSETTNHANGTIDTPMCVIHAIGFFNDENLCDESCDSTDSIVLNSDAKVEFV